MRPPAETLPLRKHGTEYPRTLFPDAEGVRLGPVSLVDRLEPGPRGEPRFARRSEDEIAVALAVAYGTWALDGFAWRLRDLEAAARRALAAGEIT